MQISSGCTSGCVCPDGLVSDGAGGCINETNCPCVHSGQMYPPGATLTVDCNTWCVSHTHTHTPSPVSTVITFTLAENPLNLQHGEKGPKGRDSRVFLVGVSTVIALNGSLSVPAMSVMPFVGSMEMVIT